MRLKRQAIAILVFLAALLLASPASASEINSQKIAIDLQDDGSAHVIVDISYSDFTSSEMYYLILARANNLRAEDEGGALLCNIEYLSYGSQISCLPKARIPRVPAAVGEAAPYSVRIEFDLDSLVNSLGSGHRFSYGEGIRIPTKSLEVDVILPEGMGLMELNGAPFVSPEDARIGSTGRRISVSWLLNALSLGQTYSFQMSFEKFISPPPAVSRELLAAGGAGVAGLIALSFVFVRRRRDHVRSETVYAVLMPGEKSVLDVIKAQGGKCRQRMIVRDTNFSKAKVSRLIVDLEARGLIAKERVGRTNMIAVVDKPAAKPPEKEEVKTPEPKPLPGIDPSLDRKKETGI